MTDAASSLTPELCSKLLPDPPARRPATGEQPSHWGGVFAMALCVFALVASEFMPVSLLTPIATDLHVSEGMVGKSTCMTS